jgi:hypothetical protein
VSFDVRASGGPVEFSIEGVDRADRALAQLNTMFPPAMIACLNELGLLLEHNIKPHVRVATGRLRSSIGHFTPTDLTARASSQDATAARNAAVFDGPTVNDLAVTVGTRVKYAAQVNYRMGDLFIERGLAETIPAIPPIVFEYLQAINRGLR